MQRQTHTTSKSLAVNQQLPRQMVIRLLYLSVYLTLSTTVSLDLSLFVSGV